MPCKMLSTGMINVSQLTTLVDFIEAAVADVKQGPHGFPLGIFPLSLLFVKEKLAPHR